MGSVQEVIKSAFSRNKFCKTMYKKLIKEKGSSQNIYLVYACYLAANGKLSESLSILYHAVKNFSPNLTFEKVTPLITKIIENLKREHNFSFETDFFTCLYCCGLLFDPVTLYCGHTFCKKCVFSDKGHSCVTCQSSAQYRVETNVLISSLTEKLFPEEIEGIKLRKNANKYLESKQYSKAIELYTEACQLVPCDHLSRGNRSHALLLLERDSDALEDAEESLSLRPEWSKGHLLKSEALFALGREEEALVSLFISAIFERTDLEKVINEIAKLLIITLRRCTLVPSGTTRHSTASDKRRSKEDKKTAADFRKCLRKRRRSSNLTKANHPFLVQEVPVVHKFLSRLTEELEEIKNSSSSYNRTLEPATIQVTDFDCPLCYLCFWEPVTTPCGHTFCRSCLDRSLDHAILCPLCKTSLRGYLCENRISVNELIENTMKKLIPEEYEERSTQHALELSELAKAGKDSQHEVPIFVATIAIPSIACPLHVFEPRYRLLLRRVMEAGTREFGMCMPSKSGENGYSDFGTMLKVCQVSPYDDGRRIVSCVGGRRFKCISKGVRDGYNTATVEYLQDEDISEEALPDLKSFHHTVNNTAKNWFESIDIETKRRILCHYGEMPVLEHEYWCLPDGPVWMWWLIAILPLEPCYQMQIIQESSLRNRLNLIYPILRVILLGQVKTA